MAASTPKIVIIGAGYDFIQCLERLLDAFLAAEGWRLQLR